MRSHLEYGPQVWHPYTATHGESSAVWITDLFEALEFELPRLTRYLSVTLIGESEAFFIVNIFLQLSIISFTSHFIFTTRCNHDQQYSIPFARTNHLKYSFLPNSISVWNNLPLAVNCTTLPMFQYYTLPLFL